MKQLLIFACFFTTVLSDFPPYNGVGNNIKNPHYGSANSFYVRQVAPQAYADNVSALANPDAPSPLLISNIVAPSPGRLVKNNLRISDFAAFWGQFVAHDMIFSFNDPVLNFTMVAPPCVHDPTEPCDGIKYDVTLPRVASFGLVNGARAIVNGMTSFVDASHVYGSSQQRCNMLRLPNTPFLRTQEDGQLMMAVPLGDKTLMSGSHPQRFLAGDVRANENPALQSLHTLLVREHNRKAREIFLDNPGWSNELIFQTARKWVIAVMQKITYDEYLPPILGSKLPEYTGYDASINPGIDVTFMVAAFRYGHSAISPLILRLTETGEEHPYGHILLRDAFFNPLPVYESGIEPILRGLAMQIDSKVDLVIIDDLRKFFINQPFDLLAVNIMRGRDVGIPPYNQVRVSLGLPPAQTWRDITSDPDAQLRLQQAYGDVNLVDLFVGGLAEDHVAGGILGQTFHAIIVDQFTRLRNGDRFWYQNPSFGLRKTDMAAIEKITLSQLIKLNTDISNFPSSVFVVPQPQQFSFVGGTAGGASTSNSSSTGTGTYTMDPKLSIEWSSSSDSITFTLRSNATGWFGIGFGSGMANADMVICAKNGQSITCSDYYSQGQKQPSLDTDLGGTTDVTDVRDLSSAEPWNKQTVRFTRKLKSSDKYDMEITKGMTSIIYAFGDSSTFGYHGPGNRGLFELNLLASSSAASAGYSVKTKSHVTGDLIIHGVVMIVGFFFVASYAILVARNPSIFPKWLERHQSVFERVMELVIIDVIIVVVAARYEGVDHSSFAHARIGYSICFLLVLTRIQGWLSKQIGYNFEKMKLLRKAHQVFGWTTYLLALGNCCLGIHDITYQIDFYRVSPYVLASAALLIIAALLLFNQIFLLFFSKKNPDGSQKNNSTNSEESSFLKNLPKFDWNEIHVRIEKGAHWAVISNVIYDVEEFREHHPGGFEVLANIYGLDGTDFFFGKQAVIVYMDGRDPDTGKPIKRPVMKKYQHSRLANSQMKVMAVGALKASTAIDFQNNLIDSPSKFVLVKLTEKVVLTSSKAKNPTYKFTFAFPDQSLRMRVLPGQAVLLRLVISGKIVTRFYTPIKAENEGSIVLFIKVYSDGLFTGFLNQLNIGSQLYMRGPLTHTEEAFNSESQDGTWRDLGLIGAGSGIAPMIQFLGYHLKQQPTEGSFEKKSSVKIDLLIIVQNENEIIAKDTIEGYQKKHPDSLRVSYLFTQGQPRPESLKELHKYYGPLSKQILLATMPQTSFVRDRHPNNIFTEDVIIPTTSTRKRSDTVRSRRKGELIKEEPSLKSLNNHSADGSQRLTPTVEMPLNPLNLAGNTLDTNWAAEQVARKMKDRELRIMISGRTDFNDSVVQMLLDLGYDESHAVPLSNSQSIFQYPTGSDKSPGVSRTAHLDVPSENNA